MNSGNTVAGRVVRMRKFHSLLLDEHGSTAVEYALLISVLGLVVLGPLVLVGTTSSGTMDRVAMSTQNMGAVVGSGAPGASGSGAMGPGSGVGVGSGSGAGFF
jgi:Flp pilus assembly pilin Flp